MRACLTDLAGDAMLVMAADHKVGPGAFRDGIEVGVDRRLNRHRIPFGIEQREVQRQVQTQLAVSIEMADPISLTLHLTAEKSSYWSKTSLMYSMQSMASGHDEAWRIMTVERKSRA